MRNTRFALAVLLAAGAMAQAPRRELTPNDTLVSPEVQADGRVVIRIYAPKASEVLVRGDWSPTYEASPLEKGETGVWSVTIGPLEADFYSYSMTVDGVRTLDPKNAHIKQGITSVDNMFFVSGEAAAFQDNRTVPHGDIRKVWYRSSTLDMQRRMHVYTPPGYDASKERYPVFYLLHGGGDEDSGWSTIGRAGFILDNLIADGKAKPMIVVMPNGSLPRPATPPADPAAFQERFTNELMKDVIPHVEKSFRVLAGAKNRALAGLSMGGGQTLRVIVANPDAFAYTAIWSMGVNQDFEKRAAEFLGSPEKLNKQFKLLSISVGDKDFTFGAAKTLAGLLKTHGINAELNVSGGGHTWINWRRYLNDFAPRLFR